MYASTAAKFYNLNYMWTAANFIIGPMRQYGHKLSTVALKQLSFVSRIGVGAGKILQRNFARILLNLTKKYFKKKVLKKKALHVNSDAISYQFGYHHFQIKACWAPFVLRFSGSFRWFSEILLGF